MSISFNEIPTTLKTPFVYAEFDGTRAQQGPSIQAYKQLILGYKTSGGSQSVLVPVRVTSAAQASQLFGAGSMLHNMAEALFANNTSTEAWFCAVAGPSGTASAGSIAFGGPATAGGVVSIYIGGRRVQVSVAATDTDAEIATATAAAINAVTSLPLTAEVDGVDTEIVNLTAKHDGLLGDKIDIRLNYNTGEALPAGVTATITAMNGGAGVPDLSTLWAAIGDIQYHLIAFPWTDSASLTNVETELASRWTALRAIEGHAITAEDGTVSALGTLGDSRNSKHLSIDGLYKCPTPVWERAAETVGIVAFYGQQDPARPFQTLARAWTKAPAIADRFTQAERNLLILDGIATNTVDTSGAVRIERVTTTYNLSPAAATDLTYLDVNTLLTLSYLRYDFRTYFANKYPRHKLGNDGQRYGAGQAIMTPKLGRAEAINLFRRWEELALVEGFEQFKSELIVERNVSDPNRLDFLLPTDLVNQLRIIGAKFEFLV